MRQSFGFIAHFDCDGFYDARFSRPGHRAATLAQMENPTPWPAKPAEVALRAVVVEGKLLDAALREVRRDTEASERVELRRLIEKYPDEVTGG